MKRRVFLGTGAAAAGVAAGAMGAGPIGAGAAAAQGGPRVGPRVQWRMASSYPKSLDTIYGAADLIARRVAEATDGGFQIRAYAAGEIVPPLQVLDAVQNNTVECGQSASYFYVGKDPAFAFDTALPFGLTARQHMAWQIHGGGLDLVRAFLKDYNVTLIPAGNTGAQMGGWFRKEIASLDDLKGLKMRIGGLAGRVLEQLGVVPQQIGGGDIYPALERGTIDAAEFVGPYDDERLGFHKVAKYYYYPGWWEGAAQIPLLINLDAWAALPAPYRVVLEQACAEANTWMLAKYDALNAAALKRLVGGGAVLRPFPRDVMAAAHDTAFALYDAIAAENAGFRTLYQSWKAFREEEYLWFRVAENTFENFVYAHQGRP